MCLLSAKRYETQFWIRLRPVTEAAGAQNSGQHESLRLNRCHCTRPPHGDRKRRLPHHGRTRCGVTMGEYQPHHPRPASSCAACARRVQEGAVPLRCADWLPRIHPSRAPVVVPGLKLPWPTCIELSLPLSGPCLRPSLTEINSRQGQAFRACSCFLGLHSRLDRLLIHISPVLRPIALITTRLSFLSTHSLSTQSSDVPFFEQTQSLFPGSSVSLLDGTTFDIHITAFSVPRNSFDPPR